MEMKFKLSHRYCKKIRIILTFVFLNLILLFQLIQIAYSLPSATVWITHSNSSPSVNSYDTITAHVIWSQMNGLDGYSITLRFFDFQKMQIREWYDSPSIYFMPNPSYPTEEDVSWFLGSISDSGSDEWHWVRIKYTNSGSFRVGIKFAVYKRAFDAVYIEAWSWYSSETWYISSSGGVQKNTDKSINNIIIKVSPLEKYTLLDMYQAVIYAKRNLNVRNFIEEYNNNISTYVSMNQQLTYFIVTFINKSLTDSITIVLPAAILTSCDIKDA